MLKFHIRNFGCRATQSDGAAIEAGLIRQGCQAAASAEAADVVILNSCTVTSAADDDLRQAVRQARRANPSARILVTGCYAQRAPEALAGLPGVRWVVGNSHKAWIPALVVSDAAPCQGEIHVGDINAQREFLAAPAEDTWSERTRPNLKIQDGCDSRCTFCIIPAVRGRGRSARPEDVVAQVRALAARYREVVLSGVNLGRWGREPGIRMRLADLVRRLLGETDIERLRLSSVEPMDLADGLLGLMASSPRIARHVHAPLQSGSDAVLRRMRRWYRARHYAGRILKTRQWMPEAAIGADVMVGFPGETEAEFDQTRRLIEELPFTYLHVFTYSERPGTPAAAMPDQVPIAVRRRRNHALRALAAAKNLEFRRRMTGRTLSVVTLEGGSAGLSDNYLKVELAAPREPNRIVEVRIGGLSETGLREAGGDPATLPAPGGQTGSENVPRG
jgi:threonylcarbamoyladenosine tRNA methylthiotransferase MtaB